jgi:hypothetical protein
VVQDICLLSLVPWRLRWSEGVSVIYSFKLLLYGRLVLEKKDEKDVARCARRGVEHVVWCGLYSLQWRYGHEFFIRKPRAQLLSAVRRPLQG